MSETKTTEELLADATKAIPEIQKAFNELQQKHDVALKEAVRKDDLDALFKDFSEKVNKSISENEDANDKLVARMKRIERYGGSATDSKSIEDLDMEAKDFADYSARKGFHVDEFKHDDLLEYKKLFPSFMRTGDRLPDKFKALSVGSDTSGGYTVHPDMGGRLVERIFETSPMRQYASIQEIGTDALEGRHDDDEAAAQWVSELGARTNTDTPDLGVWRIPVHELHAQPKASQQILEDSAINIEGWLEGKVADKFGRTENAAFVSGVGTDRPRGFTTYVDWTTAGTYQRGGIEQFDTGVNGGFAADPNGGDALINALYGLKQQYRNAATWFMNRKTLGAVRLLKDSDSQMLWQPGLQAGQPSSLIGYPVANFEDMADYTTTGALAIAVGDMRATYQIVDRRGIRVLRDPYSDKPYVIFDTTKRVGGDVLNFDSLKFVRFAA